MKNRIHKINQYLLERHPNIWNTRIVWMLLTGLLLHCIFFVIGFLSLPKVEMLHERNVVFNFFENGSVFFSIITSILLLVVWIVYLVKNNAFNNFYPTSKNDLFKQLCCYFVIILVNISFYISYMGGVKSFINMQYPDSDFYTEVSTANKAAVFLSQKVDHYTLDNIKYPSPFDTLHAFTTSYPEEYSVSFKNNYYTFYTSKDIKCYKGEECPDDYITKDKIDSLGYTVYTVKDKIVNIKPFLPTPINPVSYFYFSDNFYNPNGDKNNLKSVFDISMDWNIKYNSVAHNKYVYDLLKRNNPEELKEILSNFLNLAKKYKAKNNLTTDSWFEIIYHPKENFKVHQFIREENTINEDYFRSNDHLKAIEIYFNEHLSDYYIEHDKIHNAFENIDEVKHFSIFSPAIFILIIIAFSITMLLYIYRISSLKIFILSIISAIVISILVSLIIVLIYYLEIFDNSNDYFPLLIILLTGSLIIGFSFLDKKLSKTITGICINITASGIGLYFLLIIIIIEMYQRNQCHEEYDQYNTFRSCPTILDWLPFGAWIIAFLVSSFIFLYFYGSRIRKWKALPEG